MCSSDLPTRSAFAVGGAGRADPEAVVELPAAADAAQEHVDRHRSGRCEDASEVGTDAVGIEAGSVRRAMDQGRQADRNSVASGKSAAIRVNPGGPRALQKKKKVH